MKKELKNNRMLYTITMIGALVSLMLVWIPYTTLLGMLLSTMIALITVLVILKNRRHGWKQYIASLCISILAIIIALFVQTGVHYIQQQTALQKSRIQLDNKSFKVGQNVINETEQFRVNSVSFPSNLTNYSVNSGNKLMAISLSITNLAKKDFGTEKATLPYALSMFHIRSGNTVIPMITRNDLPNSLPEKGGIAVNSSVTANIYAEVPSGSQLELVYRQDLNVSNSNVKVPSFSIDLT